MGTSPVIASLLQMSLTPSRTLGAFRWHQAVSVELFGLVGIVELALRTTINEQMQGWHRESFGDGLWFDRAGDFLDIHGVQDIEVARSRLRAKRREATSDRLVAELNFGFWRYLLSNRYRTILWPTLRRGFPHIPTGSEKTLFSRVGRIHDLRNRIAHHEPIFGRRLDLDHRDCLLVLGAVCPVTAQWAEGISRIPEVLANTPLLR